MNIFEFDRYKDFVLARIKAMPHQGRGQMGRMAAALGMHSTLASQVFRGDKNLTPEQAAKLCDFLGLNDLESSYFLGLVNLERAGNESLRKMISRELGELRRKSLHLASRLPRSTELSEEDQAVFYSNWYYSGIRLLTSIPAYQDLDSISEYFAIPKAKARKILDFLLSRGLCVENGRRVEMGPKRTYIPAESPLVSRHHMNWRLRAIEKHETLSEKEFAVSAPMSLSERDFQRIRDRLIESVREITQIASDSPPEKLACLNIDWFKV